MPPSQLRVSNTLTGEKEVFEPLKPPFVGMYVCGPTVYGHAHLGHARPAITFDVVYRYLMHLGYKVRYVRNITDVGHLVDDADEGEDKIAKKAKVEKLEPMEVAQSYANSYHHDMAQLNTLPPSIEPLASGHIIEQIRLIEEILEAGFAYVVNGSVYFDVRSYDRFKSYGRLSGRKIEENLAQTRQLEGGEEKRDPLDFALWKKANPEHIMRWPSPWSEGFPGWHVECTAMSTKYLGAYYDIHGGGLDLTFPHHECEIAQSQAAHRSDEARYWLHNNLITVNGGQKMGKSLGNFINLKNLFSGNHQLLEKGYSPMTIRYFMLQAHYRSTLDFSNEALQAAEKGFTKLMNGLKVLRELEYPEDAEPQPQEKLEKSVQGNLDGLYHAMNDDFNTAKALASLSNLLKRVNSFQVQPENMLKLSRPTFDRLKQEFEAFTTDVLGLKEEMPEQTKNLVEGVMDLYKEAKQAKNYQEVDRIREILHRQGITLKDLKNQVDWAYEE